MDTLDQLTLVNYTPQSNYSKILNDRIQHLVGVCENLFDIDIKFIKQGYSLDTYSDEDVIHYVKRNHYLNRIFHPKQLYNLFNNRRNNENSSIKIMVCQNNNIWVHHQNKYHKLSDFIFQIENYSHDTFKQLCITEIENQNFTGNQLLVLLYIGSIFNLNAIIDYIKDYSQIQTFSLAICINYNVFDAAMSLIKSNFTDYIVYVSNESGNDITPSMLMYSDISTKYEFDYILKLHTKSDLNFLKRAYAPLLKSNLQDVLSTKNAKSSSIGFMYMEGRDDKFNKALFSKYSHLYKNTEFVPGSIFLTNATTMNNVLTFLKYNYVTLFLQNMYDNNSLNMDYSYVHFMERLFGYL